MSGGVQAPLSPILQERKDSTTNSAQKKRPFNSHQHQQKHNHWKHNNKNELAYFENNKKRQKVQLPNKFLLGKLLLKAF